MSISFEVSNYEYEMILNGIKSLEEGYFNAGNKTMANRASTLLRELEEVKKHQMAENTQILVVDINNPSSTRYLNANRIGSFLLGRKISDYLLFAVGDNNKTQQIVITSSECSEIQSQILNQIYTYSI